MKFYKAIVCSLLLVGLNAWPQTGPQSAAPTPQTAPAAQASGAPSASAGQIKIDPAKEADIRKLMELSGAAALAEQTMDSMLENVRPLITNSLPPGEYREKLVDLFYGKLKSTIDLKQLLDLQIPIYDKYFSHEEIKGLIAFYQTPLGKKTLSILPKLTMEVAETSKQWGGQLGEQCMKEVLTEHPDMESALEAAGKQQQ